MQKIAKFTKISYEQFEKDFPDFDKVRTKERYDSILLPIRSTSGSAGYDFRSTINAALNPGDSVLINTGIRCEMEEGWVLLTAPRSSLGFKYRAQLDNTLGVIDCDYAFADNEGHIKIKITNDSKENKVLEISAGDKIAQGIFVPFGITVDDTADGVRTGGIGSTGK